MKELQNLIAWANSLNGPEVECESLVEWLELEQRAALKRGGLVVARIGIGAAGFVAALMVCIVGLIVLHFPFTSLGWATTMVATIVISLLAAISLVKIAFRGKARGMARSQRAAETASAIAHLRNINGYRGLRRELGEHGVMELNEGAQLYLRCRSILTSSAWTSESADNPWAEARDDLLHGMEGAMERLALYVARKRPFSDIGPVLDEMRTATMEIQRITEKRSTSQGGAGRDLRASLARMKELAAAEEELLRARE